MNQFFKEVKSVPGSVPAKKVVEDIIEKIRPSGKILAVGDSARQHAILNYSYFKDNKDIDQLVGVNCANDQCGKFGNFEILNINAHDMPFMDAYFDSVISIMMFEHDSEFWKSLKEINRVLKRGGLFFMGVPGFVPNLKAVDCFKNKTLTKEKSYMEKSVSTICYEIHGMDYYRFSPRSLQEVFFKKYEKVTIEGALLPPRLYGYGYKK
ncbi:MAG: class I SAM-dependent methyltransferase [Pelagibacterales bacterium]|nr:class I SAM-dependent methyltransferase [Pelagibacterales bacterium]